MKKLLFYVFFTIAAVAFIVLATSGILKNPVGCDDPNATIVKLQQYEDYFILNADGGTPYEVHFDHRSNFRDLDLYKVGEFEEGFYFDYASINGEPYVYLWSDNETATESDSQRYYVAHCGFRKFAIIDTWEHDVPFPPETTPVPVPTKSPEVVIP